MRNALRIRASADPLEPSSAFERHFSPQELAAVWQLSDTTIRRMFWDEPGVLKIGKSGRYVTLRIPASVADRVRQRDSARSAPEARLAEPPVAARQFYSTAEAAGLLKVSVSKIYGLLLHGKLTAIKVEGHLRIPVDSVEELQKEAGRHA